MRLLRLIGLVLLFSCSAACLAQKVTGVKRGSADFKAIIQAVTPYANQHAAFAVRVKGDKIRKAGDWAFVASGLEPVDKKNQGDGMLIALLRKGRKWTIREILIGSGDLDKIEAEWAKRHKLPRGLLTDPHGN